MKIQLCLGSSCFARGNGANLNFLEKESQAPGGPKIELSGCLCREKCGQGPNIFIDEQHFGEMTLDKVKKVIGQLPE